MSCRQGADVTSRVRSPGVQVKSVWKAVVSAALLVAALYLLDWDGLKAAVVNLSPWMLVLTTLILLLEFPILGLRWYLIVSPIAPLPKREHMRHYLLATFLNNFTPAQLGGDVYRFLSLKGVVVNKRELAAQLVRERVVGLLGFMVFYLLCFFLVFAWNPAVLGAGQEVFTTFAWLFVAALVGFAAAPVVLHWSDARQFVQTNRALKETVRFARSVVRLGSAVDVIKLLGLSLLGGCLVWTFAVQVVAWDIDLTASFVVLGMVAILTDLVRLIPVTVQGVGIRESAFAFFFDLLGYGAEQGFIVGAVSFAAMNVAMVLAGAFGKMIPERNVGEVA